MITATSHFHAQSSKRERRATGCALPGRRSRRRGRLVNRAVAQPADRHEDVGCGWAAPDGCLLDDRRRHRVLVAETERPRSPDLVGHIVLDLERDVDGQVGDRLVAVQRKGVVPDPTGQRQLLVFVVVLILLHTSSAQGPQIGVLGILEDPVVIAEDCGALTHRRRRLDVADHQGQRRLRPFDRLLELEARRFPLSRLSQALRPGAPSSTTPLNLLGIEYAHPQRLRPTRDQGGAKSPEHGGASPAGHSQPAVGLALDVELDAVGDLERLPRKASLKRAACAPSWMDQGAAPAR